MNSSLSKATYNNKHTKTVRSKQSTDPSSQKQKLPLTNRVPVTRKVDSARFYTVTAKTKFMNTHRLMPLLLQLQGQACQKVVPIVERYRGEILIDVLPSLSILTKCEH